MDYIKGYITELLKGRRATFCGSTLSNYVGLVQLCWIGDYPRRRREGLRRGLAHCLWVYSSGAEQSPFKSKVEGSNPSTPINLLDIHAASVRYIKSERLRRGPRLRRVVIAYGNIKSDMSLLQIVQKNQKGKIK